jgi:ligand-binding sensor domain-containing protein/signal transduction histidine kinase
MRSGRVLALALALAAPGGAALEAERLPLQSYDTSNGLAHDRVRCVTADSRGFLWFCTPDGLSRFDGTRFVNYGVRQGLPHPSVEDIVEVKPGLYWIATAGGLARLRAAADPAITAYSLGSDIESDFVLAIKKDRRGRLWIGTGKGLFVLERPEGEPSFRRVEPNASRDGARFGAVEALAEAPDGTLWIGTDEGLFRTLADGRITREPVMSTAEITDLLVDGHGRIWIGHAGGLTVWTGSTGADRRPTGRESVCTLGSSSPVPVSQGHACRFQRIARLPTVVRSLSQGFNGRIWIGTTEGLIEFGGNRFRGYTAAHGLTNGVINAVTEDAAGNVWIGADAGGASKLPLHGFISFREADGLRQNYITAISESRAGRLRVRGRWPVINEFDGERFISKDLPIAGESGHLTDYDYDILEDRIGEFWVGTPKGLFRFADAEEGPPFGPTRPKLIRTLAPGLPAAFVVPSLVDSRGDIWMTTQVGDARRVVRWQRFSDRFQEFPEADVQSRPWGGLRFTEDRSGAIWFGGDRGVARHRDGHFSPIQIAESNQNLVVTGLHVDGHGRLWLGTRGAGLYRSDDPAAEQPRFRSYTAARNELSSETVWCITDDGAKYIYVGTPQGVDRLDPDTGEFKHYSVADGLAGSEVISAFRDREGRLWFGTFSGVSRLLPRTDFAHPPPTAWIGELRIRGVTEPLSSLGESSAIIRTLQPHENQLQIDYFGLGAATGEPLRYQYRLEGADSTWSIATPDRSVNYAELAAGSYRFLVRAIDTDGRPSRTPASVTFTILLPVWKRWWFLGAMASLVMASAYGVHRYRLTRLVEVERLRTRIASDLHDDLGSSLTQISILSEMVRVQLSGQAPRLTEPLARIGTLSRESVDSMSDIVWAIDPLLDTPQHLLQRMRQFVNELLDVRGVTVQFEASGDTRRQLASDLRRHVFLIFKELLNNVVRHANATTVSVKVTVAPRELQLWVTDDGRGFESGGATPGHGLRGMQRRAADLGGSLDVASQPGSGTRAHLILPIR